MDDAADRATESGASDGDADPLLGRKLGGYEIRRLIGRGGFADVYLAVQTSLQREVALKVLREDGTGVDPAQVDAFLREARAAAAFDHPCLVQVFDVGAAEGKHFLSMEYLRGGNLARRIKTRGPLPWRDAVLIAMDVADALQCAHEHGLLHQDVKPANILLTAKGEAKLADLGLVVSGENAGTRAFVAPERILRKPADARSDLYSFGCTLYSMLTGAPPFPYASSKQMLAAHVQEAPRSLASHGLIVPDELQDLVTHLLAKDPGQRPESAARTADLLEFIEECGTSRERRPPPSAPPPSAPPQPVPVAATPPATESPAATSTRRRTRRRAEGSDIPWSTLLGLGFLAIVVLAVIWAWRRYAP